MADISVQEESIRDGYVSIQIINRRGNYWNWWFQYVESAVSSMWSQKEEKCPPKRYVTLPFFIEENKMPLIWHFFDEI